MIETYDAPSRRSTIQYLARNLVVSFKAAEFTRVFGIPGPQGKQVQPKKISKDGKLFLIRLVCGDLSEADQAALAETSKRRGLKKTDIQEGPWRCLMDLVKSRLTGSSRASDISFPQVSLMNGIMTGKVYDWASVLAERMHEFMTLQHKIFYMPHYAIGLFLDAAARMIPADELEARPGPLTPGEPPIMQWKHLDTATGQKCSAGQKRSRMDMAGDTDSGRQETSSEEVSMEEGGEGEDEEVQVVTATPLLFPRTTVPVTSGVVPTGLQMAHIPGFGQTRRPILMTGVPQQAVTLAAPWQHGVRPSPIRPGVGFAVGFAQLTAPIARETSSAPAETLLVTAPVAPAISQPATVVTVARVAGEHVSDEGMQAERMDPVQSEQPEVMDRASVFLRQQFRLVPDRRGPSIQSPSYSGAASVVPEPLPQEQGVPQAVVAPSAEEAAPAVGIGPGDDEANSDAEWSLEGFAKEDYGSDEDRCRDYLRTMKSALKKGHDVAIEAMTRRREWHLIRGYIRGVCPRRFQTCFMDRGWPEVETPEMLADWATEPELGPSDTPLMKLAHEIVGLYKEVYYARRRAEADREADIVTAQRSLSVEREAREKLAAELADQQAAWAAERTTLLQAKDAATRDAEAAIRDKVVAEHELELARRQAMDAALLLKEAVEVNSQIQTDLRIRTEQVYELRRQQHSSGTPPPSL